MCSVAASLETGLGWGVPRGSARGAEDHGSLLTQVQELPPMVVNGAVTVLQLCRGIIIKVCDPALSCHADPGIEVPSQQDNAI